MVLMFTTDRSITTGSVKVMIVSVEVMIVSDTIDMSAKANDTIMSDTTDMSENVNVIIMNVIIMNVMIMSVVIVSNTIMSDTIMSVTIDMIRTANVVIVSGITSMNIAVRIGTAAVRGVEKIPCMGK